MGRHIPTALARNSGHRRWWWLCLALLPVIAGAADDRWALCPAPQQPLPDLGAPDDTSLHLSADRVEAQGEGLTRFSGDVVLLYGGRRIEAQEAVFDKEHNALQLDGEVKVYSKDLSASGSSAQFDIDHNSGALQDARYQFRSSHSSGSAERVIIRDSQHTELSGASYTTCPPDKLDWQLKADSIELDDSTNTGEARHVTVEFKGVPFIYLPYINFPLYGRKSGLLAPSFGSSDKTGTDISLPYYWNIAPNYDATFTPRHMTERGSMLLSEFRYLTPGSNGQLELDVLPQDKAYDDEKRVHGAYRHNAQWGEGWSNAIVYNYVSDPYYFNDLNNSQSSASATHLERRLDMAYQGEGWNFLGRVQGYQTLSGTEPYQRLPQLRLDAATPRRRNTLRYSLGSELVHFAHHELVPTGTRVDITPAVNLPLGGPAWFLNPRVAVRHTEYQLNDYSTGDSLNRTLPITSLDSGLIFERAWGDEQHPLVQTLEPRLYYLYVPYKDQSDLPVFDSAAYDFSFAQLFRDNRFSGADRQGDADQLTLALTSRLEDGLTGDELLRGSIGQIQYFSDRRVTLPGVTTEERQRSDIVAEVGARPLKGLDLSATGRWNPDEERNELTTTRIRYQPEHGKYLGLDYRFRRDLDMRQTDVVAYWPLSRRWRFLGRWNYDLEAERTLETVAGLAWEDCCWALHFAARERLDTLTLNTNHSFFLTLELKGLSSLGRRLEDELERGILKRQ